MGEYVDNIRRIANKKQNKGGLSTATKLSGLPGNIKLLSDLDADNNSGGGVGLVSPVVMDVLTMEAMPCADTPNCTIYRALTYKLTDAANTVIEVSEINWPEIQP